jgi:hypothetical protein
VGGGGAIAIVGAVLLPIGLGNVNSAQAICGPNHNMCPNNSAAIAQGNAGLAETRAGGVLIGVGVAAAVGGLAWQFAGNKAGPAAQAKNLWLKPMAGPGASGVVAGGAF